jgi:hypothetical protein
MRRVRKRVWLLRAGIPIPVRLFLIFLGHGFTQKWNEKSFYINARGDIRSRP